MASISETVSKKGPRFKALIRRTGFPNVYKTFGNREDAEKWAAIQESKIKGEFIEGNADGSHYLQIISHQQKREALLLRKYQELCVTKTSHALQKNSLSAPLIVMPTGSGKTIVISAMIEMILRSDPDAKFLVLAHVSELVEQNYKKYSSVSSVDKNNIGVLSASVGVKQSDKKIIFGSIQTAVNYKNVLSPTYIVIDEAHCIPVADSSMYRELISSVRLRNTACRVVGLTATPFRLSSGHLLEGSDRLFTEISYSVDIRELIANKYLCPLVSAGSTVHVDEHSLLLGVDDFEQKSTSRSMQLLTKAIVKDVIARSVGRKSWLVFCVDKNHANNVASTLNKANISAEVITANTSTADRSKYINDFKQGKLKCLVNVNVLTTGFDAPETDLIVSLRPTKSPGLWVQICGRGMRVANDKRNCLVLDYANNIARHGTLEDIDGISASDATSRGGDNRILTTCPQCKTDCHPKLKICPNCGELLSREASIRLSLNASVLPVMKLTGDEDKDEKRINDLIETIKWYSVGDIEKEITAGVNDKQRLESIYRYIGIYQRLLDSVEGVECTFGVKDLAIKIERDEMELRRAIKDRIFPVPRLLCESGDLGYSIMQVAMILSGDESVMLICDDSYLYYLHLLNILFLDRTLILSKINSSNPLELSQINFA